MIGKVQKVKTQWRETYVSDDEGDEKRRNKNRDSSRGNIKRGSLMGSGSTRGKGRGPSSVRLNAAEQNINMMKSSFHRENQIKKQMKEKKMSKIKYYDLKNLLENVKPRQLNLTKTYYKR